MTIDGVDISGHGLFVVEAKGFVDQESRKKTTQKDYFTANDIVFNNRDIKVKLSGQYETGSALSSAVTWVNGFADGDSHTFVFSNYRTVTGRITNGTKVKIENLIVWVEFTIKE